MKTRRVFLSLAFRNIKISAFMWLVTVVHYGWLLAVHKHVERVVAVNRKVPL
jgi:hypothetical protein